MYCFQQCVNCNVLFTTDITILPANVFHSTLYLTLCSCKCNVVSGIRFYVRTARHCALAYSRKRRALIKFWDDLRWSKLSDTNVLNRRVV